MKFWEALREMQENGKKMVMGNYIEVMHWNNGLCNRLGDRLQFISPQMQMADWQEYQEQKKKKKVLVSPAIIKFRQNIKWEISDFLYCSIEQVHKNFNPENADIIWPARDANGNPIQYEVEVDE